MNIRLRITLSSIGALTAAGIAPALLRAQPALSAAAYVLAMAAGGLLVFLLAPLLERPVRAALLRLAQRVGRRPLPELLLGLGGALAGLTVAHFAAALMQSVAPGASGAALSLPAYAALGAGGYALGGRWRELPLPARTEASAEACPDEPPAPAGVPKLLDTSVLVDGRIYDICRTGFMEGPLVLPQFVLEELQHIADSSDTLRRNRGRRGLDVVARIQKELDIPLIIDDTDIPESSDVDIKLLRLTRALGGRVVTNDFNLNKVAEVSGVSVLNINELAGALKPVLLPGEELSVQIVREGKELGQGVAFMDDGTMIVVENGRRFIGQSVTVHVNTVLQTAAGRMIFARLREKTAV